MEKMLPQDIEVIQRLWIDNLNKTTAILKISTLIAYSVHPVLLNFSNDYEMWLIESEHS